jgi:hypothetical protein
MTNNLGGSILALVFRRKGGKRPTGPRCPILAFAFRRKGGKLAAHFLLAVSLAPAFAVLPACHSYHIDTTIENRTGASVQLLEVDYPSASFGADSLAAGAGFHYRFQVRGSGPLKLSYTAPNHHQFQITGPTLFEGQQGQLQIILLPGGQAQFHPQLTPAS